MTEVECLKDVVPSESTTYIDGTLRDRKQATDPTTTSWYYDYIMNPRNYQYEGAHYL